jgi:aminopeptidase-like protein
MSLFISKEWIKVAYDDIMLLEEIKNNQYLTSIIAFHSQQAIEKSLKALLVEQELNILFNECKNQIVNKLDKLYIDSKYTQEIWGFCLMANQHLKMQKSFMNLQLKYLIKFVRF